MEGFMFSKVEDNSSTSLNETSHGNGNGKNCSLETPISFAVGYIIFALPGLFLNTMFIVTVVRQRSMRKPLTLTMMLSFGDLLLAGFVLALGLNNVIVIRGGPFALTKLACFYRRPYLSIFICGTLLQSTANLLVAIERTAAILKPYQFYKAEKTNAIYGICALTIVFVMVAYTGGIIYTAIHYRDQDAYNGLCYPGTAINEGYSGFLYVFSVAFGFIAMACYVAIFGFIFYKKYFINKKYKVKEGIKLDRVQRKRQMWLLKICSILTLNTFFFIVIPYSILYLSINDKCPTSVLWFVRRYVSFLLAINSFSGMTLSFVVSRELRTAVVAMFKRKSLSNSSVRNSSMNLARLSSTKMTELDPVYRTISSLH